jgi:hypothetical protein
MRQITFSSLVRDRYDPLSVGDFCHQPFQFLTGGAGIRSKAAQARWI